MKKYILLITSALSLMFAPAMAQSNNNADEVVKIEHHTANQYREGEIIVKFKSTSAARIRSHKRGITSGVDNIDNIINELGISKSEPLMPFTGAKGVSRTQQLRSVSGNTIEANDLSQLYLLSFDSTKNNVHEAVSKIAALDEVEYAEPNYLVYTLSSGDGSELADCAKEATAYISEPLYSQQWGLEAINLPSLWKMPKTTDKRPVIAILDTGVDITHPDLADNIWTNEAEAEGAEYEDDDNNGFADDLHGWDFVNQTPRLGDWNGHGTHCAGIAAAVGTNGIGVTGANPDALIMPIAVMQSDGSGDVATIIKGIDYAAANGADVISMSIGGYNYSIAQEQALARAYQTAVLVAAAGNDCKPINPTLCFKCGLKGLPMYPAAFTFVLGVQASADSNGSLASFSNYDDDGPTFSKFGDERLYNYELTVPGTNIISTYPGGKYKQLNGTSMACPMAAGAISRLLQSKEYASKELLFGDLINTSNGNMDILATYCVKDDERKPELQFVTYMLNDDIETSYYIDNTNTSDGFKVSTDKEEYWYCIKFNAEEKKFTSSVSGAKISAGTTNCGDDDLWKITGTYETGYTLTNRHGYTLFVNSDNINEAAYASLSPKNISKFDIIESALHKGCYEIHPAGNPNLTLAVSNTSIILDWGANNENGVIKFQPAKIIEEFVSSDNINLQGDGDGKADTGEIIGIYPTLRTTWGIADNITFSLELGENEDAEIVEIIDKEVAFGKKLSSYAQARSMTPLRFRINDKCVDGRHIKLSLRATCDNAKNELIQDFVITVENGMEIGGMIAEDMTLYPNIHYIVTRALAIPEGVTLTIKPGTVLKFEDNTGISCAGNIKCEGTADSMIVFTKKDLANGIVSNFIFSDPIKYVKFSFLTSNGHSISDGNSPFFHGIFEHCIFENCVSNHPFFFLNTTLRNCNIYNCTSTREGLWVEFAYSSEPTTKFIDSNICSNSSTAMSFDTFKNAHENAHAPQSLFNSNIFNNTCTYTNVKFNLSAYTDTPKVLKLNTPSYFGSLKESIVREGIYDMYHPTNPIGFGMVNLSNMLARPSAEAHGIVWKVVVNGYDAQDEFELLPPLGVGKHKFEVFFNRPMDVSVAPNIAMGVRPPYTQKPIAEDGRWSADSLIYTAYLTIDGKSDIDGLNRIYVADAIDNEHFDVPVEDKRFNVEVAAIGSMATGLMAEAGLGKVTLTWETDKEDFEDLLGYNIYRHTEVEDSTFVEYDENWNWLGEWLHFTRMDTIIANETVIESEETTFTDYNVEPRKTYYYTIKQITTSLNSYALSNVVAATPQTAEKGDANGSAAVDVADVVTAVDYLTNQKPQPFIFEAADVNSDNKINILDIVGIVNIISPHSNPIPPANKTATYTVEDGILYMETPVALAGIQVKITSDKGSEFTVLDALSGFEQIGNWQTDNEYLFLAFSMSGKSIAAGKHALLKVGNTMIREVVLSNTSGGNIIAIDGGITSIGSVEGMQICLPYPNPFSTELNIPYVIGKKGSYNVRIVVHDVAGRTLHSYAAVNSYDEHNYTWHPDANISSGFYFVSLYVNNALMHTAKVIYKK